MISQDRVVTELAQWLTELFMELIEYNGDTLPAQHMATKVTEVTRRPSTYTYSLATLLNTWHQTWNNTRFSVKIKGKTSI